MKTLVKSKRIYTEDGIISGGILFSNRIEKIIADLDRINLAEDVNVIDVKDMRVIPGLIDVHIHGAGGWGRPYESINIVQNLSRYLTSLGVTSYLITTSGMTEDLLVEKLKLFSSACETGHRGSKLLGIHMEGPFLNPLKKGGFGVNYIWNPSIEKINKYLKASNDHIKYITLAPELEGAMEIIEYLRDKNIVLACGHSNGTVVDFNRSVDKGIKVATHVGNAMRGIHHREPGIFGGSLLDNRVTCELIADFIHIHPQIIKMIYRLKGKEKIMLISDSNILSGQKPGKYIIDDITKYVEENGKIHLEDGTISGSSRHMLYGVKNLVEELNIKLEDVITMSALNQARILDIGDVKGSIKEDKDADIVIIDEDYNAIMTFVEGNLEYDKNLALNFRNCI